MFLWREDEPLPFRYENTGVAFVHTDGVAGDGKCQEAIIDFDRR
jgi:hypothetical protein